MSAASRSESPMSEISCSTGWVCSRLLSWKKAIESHAMRSRRPCRTDHGSGSSGLVAASSGLFTMQSIVRTSRSETVMRPPITITVALCRKQILGFPGYRPGVRWLEVRRHSYTKKGAARGRGSHLSAEGVAFARAIGATLGPFSYVVTNELPRAVETAVAMGFAVD